MPNSVDPDQTAQEQSDLGLHWLLGLTCNLFQYLVSRMDGWLATLRPFHIRTMDG